MKLIGTGLIMQLKTTHRPGPDGPPSYRAACLTLKESNIMNARVLTLAAALILSAAGAVHAEQTALGQSVPATVANHWLYDVNGNTIGSVRKLTDGGQTAVIMVGDYLRPGSHEATVPVSALAIHNGRVTLEGNTVQALNLTARR